jgi:ABC-2 type transport system permease protein
MSKYWAIFKIQLANRLAYVGDLLAGSLTILIFMFVFLQLWRATYSMSGESLIAGLRLQDTLWYLMLTEAIQLSKPRLSRILSDAVKDGSIAYLLNKPYNFLLYQLSIGLADGVSRFGFNVMMGGAMLWLLISPPPNPLGWPLVLTAVLLGWILDFCVQALIGLAAFTVEDVSAFDWVYQKLIFILGGMLIPLDFFPPWLKSVAQALPFAYTMYGPARLFIQPDAGRFGALVLGQILWIGVFGIILGLAFRRGLQRLTVNGG